VLPFVVRSVAVLAAMLVCGCCSAVCAQATATRRDHDGNPLPPEANYRLGTTAWRDCVASESMRFSPDGQRLAYLRRFCDVRILDARAGKILRTFHPSKLPSGEELQHVQLDWSPSGSEIAIRSMTGRVAILDALTGEPRWTHQFQSENPDHSHLGPLR